MKKLVTSLCMLTLVTATSCSGTTREGQDAAKSGSTGISAKPVQRLANKPVAGETEHTFSLSVPFESVDLAQGEEKSIQIGINRGENFAEQVKIKVSGLPKGVTMETKEPVITQGNTGVELTFKAASDAALGDFTAEVIGHTASSGADFSKEVKLTVSQK